MNAEDRVDRLASLKQQLASIIGGWRSWKKTIVANSSWVFKVHPISTA